MNPAAVLGLLNGIQIVQAALSVGMNVDTFLTKMSNRIKANEAAGKETTVGEVMAFFDEGDELEAQALAVVTAALGAGDPSDDDSDE